MMPAAAMVALAGGYLIGSIPFGVLAGWCRGIDIRQAGSGNIGATNVGRHLGRPWGFAVFALDFLKGFGPTWWGPAIAAAVGGGLSGGAVPEASGAEWIRIGAAVGSVFGHVFPVTLGFKGGKGVATGAGACLALAPIPTGCGLVAWALVLAATRYMSLASIAGALTLPIAHPLRSEAAWPGDGPIEAVLILLALVVVLRHRGNLSRLLKGTEPKVGSKVGPERQEPS